MHIQQMTGFKLYLNTMDCLYHKNAVKLDIAGTIESISKIDPDVLYKCYNTFYHPSNMTLVVCGDFKPEDILEEMKKRLQPKENQGEITKHRGNSKKTYCNRSITKYVDW